MANRNLSKTSETSSVNSEEQSWNSLAKELQDSNIPPETIQSLLSAYREIEREIDPKDVAQVMRERIVRLLDHNEARKLDVSRGESPDDVETWVASRKKEQERARIWENLSVCREDLITISPMDFQSRISDIFKQVVDHRIPFLIKRHSKEMALLMSLEQNASFSPSNTIPINHLARNRSLLNEVANGRQIWISRRNKVIATLIPPPISTEYNLSVHEKHESEPPEQLVLISPMDLQNRIGQIVDQVINNQTSFLIKRWKKELAILTPLMGRASLPQDRVVSTQSLLKNRKILDDVSRGQIYQLSRRNKIVATLVPPKIAVDEKLSETDRKKLQLVRELSVEQLRIAIQLVTGEITLKDVIENKG